ncbi:hypothetical protein D5018_05860 [Parashewanella curva]|uniref:Uncharacterized protein n=1 Tax=Parashewanella curva TaxID=2338552 RepID=A0A3L8PZ93_9GAMM|nr:hypothetical protein D5018_05860 [Parashewanella curva]
MAKLHCSRLEQKSAQIAQNLILKDQHALIPITVIKCTAQSYVCVQSTSEIDEDIVTLHRENFAQQFGHIQAPRGQGQSLSLPRYKFLNYPDSTSNLSLVLKAFRSC